MVVPIAVAVEVALAVEEAAALAASDAGRGQASWCAADARQRLYLRGGAGMALGWRGRWRPLSVHPFTATVASRSGHWRPSRPAAATMVMVAVVGLAIASTSGGVTRGSNEGGAGGGEERRPACPV